MDSLKKSQPSIAAKVIKSKPNFHKQPLPEDEVDSKMRQQRNINHHQFS